MWYNLLSVTRVQNYPLPYKRFMITGFNCFRKQSGYMFQLNTCVTFDDISKPFWYYFCTRATYNLLLFFLHNITVRDSDPLSTRCKAQHTMSLRKGIDFVTHLLCAKSNYEDNF